MAIAGRSQADTMYVNGLIPKVRRTYQGQNNKEEAREGMTVPHATPRIPIRFTRKTLSTKLQSPSASDAGTRGLCLLKPSMLPAVTELAAQKTSVNDRTHNTLPERSAY